MSGRWRARRALSRALRRRGARRPAGRRRPGGSAAGARVRPAEPALAPRRLLDVGLRDGLVRVAGSSRTSTARPRRGIVWGGYDLVALRPGRPRRDLGVGGRCPALGRARGRGPRGRRAPGGRGRARAAWTCWTRTAVLLDRVHAASELRTSSWPTSRRRRARRCSSAARTDRLGAGSACRGGDGASVAEVPGAARRRVSRVRLGALQPEPRRAGDLDGDGDLELVNPTDTHYVTALDGAGPNSPRARGTAAGRSGARWAST